jgi:putative restriction endonuclease
LRFVEAIRMLPGVAPDPRDLDLRQRALEHVRVLSQRYDDIVPIEALRPGFATPRGQISYGSFYNGIYRPKEFAGPAALSLVTTPPKERRDAPYDDEFDESTGTFTYHYRRPRSDSARARLSAAADNRSLTEALRLGVPLIYFRGIAPGQYTPVAPVFLTRDDPGREVVSFQVALPIADTTAAGVTSDELTRRYATREAQFRLHQHYFRQRVLRAYRTRCAVCALREAPLLQAAHIIEDRDPRGAAAVVNGIALCAIHHLAYDRNLLGIAPDGVVHIATRLLEEIDGPMLRVGLQGFHGSAITQPRDRRDRPDPDRLRARFEGFRAVV